MRRIPATALAALMGTVALTTPSIASACCYNAGGGDPGGDGPNGNLVSGWGGTDNGGGYSDASRAAVQALIDHVVATSPYRGSDDTGRLMGVDSVRDAADEVATRHQQLADLKARAGTYSQATEYHASKRAIESKLEEAEDRLKAASRVATERLPTSRVTTEPRELEHLEGPEDRVRQERYREAARMGGRHGGWTGGKLDRNTREGRINRERLGAAVAGGIAGGIAGYRTGSAAGAGPGVVGAIGGAAAGARTGYGFGERAGIASENRRSAAQRAERQRTYGARERAAKRDRDSNARDKAGKSGRK